VLRVHDVRAMRQALAMTERLDAKRPPEAARV
jgi:dihydropteroate synthase